MTAAERPAAGVAARTGKQFLNGLRDDDTWQAGKLTRGAAELRFWGV